MIFRYLSGLVVASELTRGLREEHENRGNQNR